MVSVGSEGVGETRLYSSLDLASFLVVVSFCADSLLDGGKGNQRILDVVGLAVAAPKGKGTQHTRRACFTSMKLHYRLCW